MTQFWSITDNSQTIIANFEVGKNVSLAGRVVSFRNMGNIAFGHIQDSKGRIQFCLNKKLYPSVEAFKQISNAIKIGDIVGVNGELWLPSTQEKTILVNQGMQILQSSTMPFPDKWNGITDPEAKLRKRYLNCILDNDYRNVFYTRSNIIKTIRSFMEENGFLEVETPVLCPQASGAQAKPFITHHNALDGDFYLRIAPETYLKRMMVAGFEKIFEIGKQFRNEGIDPTHLQEFTTIEWYWAFANYMDNLAFFNHLIKRILYSCVPSEQRDYGYKITYQDQELDFSNIPTVSYVDLFRNHDKDVFEMTYQEADSFFKKVIRPTLVQPVYVVDYPAHMSPMAVRKADNPNLVEQWQFIVMGQEIVKCYTEITDVNLQRKLLEEQMAAKMTGKDDEAMDLEEDFLEAMSYGMPPMSGVGVGIDRLVCLLTNQTSLKDVVFSPQLKIKS